MYRQPGLICISSSAIMAGIQAQPTTCAWFAQTLLDEFTMNGIVARERNISLDGTGDDHVVTEYSDRSTRSGKWRIRPSA